MQMLGRSKGHRECWEEEASPEDPDYPWLWPTCSPASHSANLLFTSALRLGLCKLPRLALNLLRGFRLVILLPQPLKQLEFQDCGPKVLRFYA